MGNGKKDVRIQVKGERGWDVRPASVREAGSCWAENWTGVVHARLAAADVA